MMTFPDGLGKFFAGHLTFRETLSDFIANCTFMTNSSMRCSEHVINHWTMGFSNPLYALFIYFLFYFIMVAICITLYIPSGIFVPCFVMGASAGRLIGEVLAQTWPEGMRGLDGPQIYPGLYAVIGAAAYTGSVTHSLSIALIVCETTGQLCALLPVLIALMIANAICSFLQPSIYESTIKIQNYPYLADLPPSRISVHTTKVDQIMLRDIVYITRDTTYRELREILLETSHLRSYPFVADRSKIFLRFKKVSA
ncbi:hypothetical protein WR25_01022 [Diploscapter pachys]|uniref:Chloride channel protein n=1 Tax=Diploscapter pachys TaxID=2018661 RepID=A0A2A2M0D7_9BILA|nr:hypothetical protein WR25_01022 [Diploscapter pachys]